LIAQSVQPLLSNVKNRQIFFSSTQTQCFRLYITKFHQLSKSFNPSLSEIHQLIDIHSSTSTQLSIQIHQIFELLFNLLAQIEDWNLVLSVVEVVETMLTKSTNKFNLPNLGHSVHQGFMLAGGMNRLRSCLQSARSAAVSSTVTKSSSSGSSALQGGISSWIDLKIRALEQSLPIVAL
jgi:hypothetical protein